MNKNLPLVALALALAGCGQQSVDRADSDVADTAAVTVAANNTGGNAGTPGSVGTDTGTASQSSDADAVAPDTLNESASLDEERSSGIAPQKAMSATDRALMNRVRNNLLGLPDSQGPAVSSESLNNLQIQAHRGIVTLRGNVKSDSEKQIVADRVQRMDGVVVVKNELQVAGAQPPLNIGNAPSQQAGSAESNSKAASEESKSDAAPDNGAKQE